MKEFGVIMALAEKTFDANALPDLLKSMFGTKTTTKTGGSTSTSSTTANTAPLQQVFDSASKPMDQQLYDNLIASIFQKAAGQVPTLTAALANATGSRSSGNSPLALALNEQNNMAARDSATAILAQQNQQQQTAGNAAAQIANASKSVTNTTSPSTSTVAAKPGVNPLATTALGFLLNQADKKGLFGKLGSMFDSTTAAPTSNFAAAAPSFGTAFGGPSPTTSFAAPSSFLDTSIGSGNILDSSFGGANLNDFGSMFGGADLGGLDFGSLLGSGGYDFGGGLDFSSLLGSGGGFDFGSSLSGFDSGGLDFGSVFDVGGGSALTDITAGGGFGALPNDIWNFFANGGMTNRRPAWARYPRQVPDTHGPNDRFADGGNTAPVIRNRNNMGLSPTLFGQSAINIAPSAGAGSAGALQSDMLMQMLQRAVQEGQVKAATPQAPQGAKAPQAAMVSGGADSQIAGRETAGGAVNDMAGNPLGSKVGQAMAMAALGLMMPAIAGTMSGSMTAAQMTGPAMKAAGVGGSPLSLAMAIAQATKAQGDATTAIQSAEDPLGALLGAFSAVNPGSVGNVSAAGSGNLAAGANAASSITGVDPLTALLQATNAFGTMSNSDSLAASANASASRNGIDPMDALMAGTNAFGTGPVGGGSDAGGSSPGADSFGGAGDFGGVGLFANGGNTGGRTTGMIRGPGNGTSDSITAKSTVPGKGNIKVSDKEYIIPADVVARPGVQTMLDQLLASYHSPV